VCVRTLGLEYSNLLFLLTAQSFLDIKNYNFDILELIMLDMSYLINTLNVYLINDDIRQ
jgi:hypothetical protein